MPTPGSLMTTPQLPAYATDPEFWKRAAAARQRRGAPAQMIETMTGITPNPDLRLPVSAGGAEAPPSRAPFPSPPWTEPQAAPPAGVQTGELFTEPTRTEGGPLLEGVDMEALFKKIAPFRSMGGAPQMQQPRSYGQGVSRMQQAPVRPSGDPRDPGLTATVPLRENMQLDLSGSPGLGGLARGGEPSPRGMATLRGRF